MTRTSNGMATLCRTVRAAVFMMTSSNVSFFSVGGGRPAPGPRPGGRQVPSWKRMSPPRDEMLRLPVAERGTKDRA